MKDNKNITISIFEVVGSEFCVAADDGQLIFDQIKRAFTEGYAVELTFKNVKRLTSAFLNVAIGQLYGEYTQEFIKEHLRVKEISPGDANLLKRVVDRAKVFFSDPDTYQDAYNKVIGE